MCTAKSHVRFTPNSDRESGHSLALGFRANPKAALNRRLRCQRHNAESPVAIARVPRKFISKISQTIKAPEKILRLQNSASPGATVADCRMRFADCRYLASGAFFQWAGGQCEQGSK